MYAVLYGGIEIFEIAMKLSVENSSQLSCKCKVCCRAVARRAEQV